MIYGNSLISTPPSYDGTPQEGNNSMHDKIPLLRGGFLLYFCMGGRRGGVKKTKYVTIKKNLNTKKRHIDAFL
jgi:hypothetical protein